MSLVGVNRVPALLVISRILFYFSDKMLRGGSQASQTGGDSALGGAAHSIYL